MCILVILLNVNWNTTKVRVKYWYLRCHIVTNAHVLSRFSRAPSTAWPKASLIVPWSARSLVPFSTPITAQIVKLRLWRTASHNKGRVLAFMPTSSVRPAKWWISIFYQNFLNTNFELSPSECWNLTFYKISTKCAFSVLREKTWRHDMITEIP